MAKGQPVNINFSQGLDTKTDPFQLPIGRFLRLQNSVFLKGGRLSKRNGYAMLTSPANSPSLLTTFDGALVSVGSNVSSLSASANLWKSVGSFTAIKVDTLPLIRNNINQSQADAAVAANGLVCTVYTESDGSTTSYKYAIADSVTGTNVVAPTAIPSAASGGGGPKVFALGSYFVIVYTTHPGAYNLAYIAISTTTGVAGSSTVISTSYTPATTGAFDGVVFSNSLYLAWNGAAASGIKCAFLTNTLVLSASVNPDAAHVATIVSVCADDVNNQIWVSYYASGTTNGYAFVINPVLGVVHAAVAMITSVAVVNLASSATSGVMTLLYEVTNAYSYDSTIASNFIRKRTLNTAGTAGTAADVLRSVGLASKAFMIDEVAYFACVYSSPYQPTYLVSDNAGNIVAKLAYQNGGGYLTTGLPNVSVIDSEASFPYLLKDLITAVNKDTNVAAGTQTAGIYSQTGINLAALTFGMPPVVSEIGNNLNLTGGITWAYDGYVLTEQGFHLYPDSVEMTNPTAPVPTGDTTNTSPTILNVSSTTNLVVGMNISGTGIPAQTIVTAISGTTITINKNATATNTGTTLTFTGNVADGTYYYQVTYEWTDNQGNAFRSSPSIPVTIATSASGKFVLVKVPTLRLTYKTANPVKIVVYRWSTAQQVYYQTTSITVPVLNSTTTDSVSFEDINSDATILGNNILYTTGGVVGNSGAPSYKSVFLFDDRLFGITSEDQNLLTYSKQVVESTPVELSDLLTMYIAPNTGAQGPSGVLECGFPMDDKAILFKKSSILYFNGIGPDNTGSNNQYSQPVLITSTIGCVNQNSIVFMPDGLMFEFQSEAGNQIWLLGRDLSTRDNYIGAPVEDYTRDATVLSAVNIPGTNQVRFTMSSGITLMYDYYYRQWGTFTQVPAISSTLYQGLHAYVDTYDRVFKETPNQYLDGSNPVLMAFTTGWINLAGLQGYERIYEFILLATYLSPHFLWVQIANDYKASPTQTRLIRPDNFSAAEASPFGVPVPFGAPSSLEQWEFSMKKQKTQAFQISIDEQFDPQFGTVPGAGFTMSGINCNVGIKKGYRPIKSANSTG